MGTRCKIGYKESTKDKLSECFYKLKGNAITATYCHYDGYLDGVGSKLLAHYSDPQLAYDLSTVGYITALHETMKESIEQSYDPVTPPYTPEYYSCIDEYKEEIDYVDFLYLYDLGKKTWQYYTHVITTIESLSKKYRPKQSGDFVDIPDPRLLLLK